MWKTVLIIIIAICLIYFFRKSTKRNVKLTLYFDFFLFFSSFFMLFILWPYLLLSPKSTKNTKFCASLVRHVAKYTNIKWELRNWNILAEDRAAVIVANHQSLLDTIGLFIIWDVSDKMFVISKKETFYFWTIGITFYLCGAVYIDRENPTSAYKKIKSVINTLNQNNTKLWIFAEGTRNKDLFKLLPFKSGAFIAAVEAQLPIIPLVYSPYHFFEKGKETLLLRGPIVIECLTPEPTEGLTVGDVPALMRRIHERMDAKYKQLSEEVLDYYNFYCDGEYSNRPVLTLKN